MHIGLSHSPSNAHRPQEAYDRPCCGTDAASRLDELTEEETLEMEITMIEQENTVELRY